MPLPLIPVAIALGTAVAGGTAAAISGKLDLDEAKEIDAKAQEKNKEIQNRLEATRQRVNRALENLGRKKLDICTSGSVARFLEVASKLKNMPENEFADVLEEARPVSDILRELHDISVQFTDIAGGVLASGGSGALAAIAALGGVKALAVAGTGTAISGLSGAAATNATLAWLGGGTLASGGLGVAGGMAVVGGIVVAPLVLVGGLVFASIGEKALEQAKENQAKVEAFDKSSKAICQNLDKIGEASAQMYSVLRSMDILFGRFVDRLESVVAASDNYAEYTRENKKLVKNCFMFNEHMKSLLETKLMDQDGKLLGACLENIKKQEKFMEKMNVL